MRSLVTTVVLAGAACSTARPSPAVAVAVAKRADLLAPLLRDHCAGCHDGSDELPRIDGLTALDRTLAVKAALMVVTNKMPPPPADLADRDRQMLVGELCGSGAPDPEACRRSMTPLRGAVSMSPPQELIAALDRVAPAPPGPTAAPRPAAPRSSVELMLLGHVQSKRLVVHLDPTFEALWLLLTTERCPPPAAGSQAFETCVATMASGELGRLPRPAPDESTGAPKGGSR